MKIVLAALFVTSAIAIVAAVFAFWPVVADAPWEDDAGDRIVELRCEGALALRVSIIEAGEFSPGSFSGGRRSCSGDAPIAAVPGNPSGIADYDKALADAENEIHRFC